MISTQTLSGRVFDVDSVENCFIWQPCENLKLSMKM